GGKSAKAREFEAGIELGAIRRGHFECIGKICLLDQGGGQVSRNHQVVRKRPMRLAEMESPALQVAHAATEHADHRVDWPRIRALLQTLLANDACLGERTASRRLRRPSDGLERARIQLWLSVRHCEF